MYIAHYQNILNALTVIHPNINPAVHTRDLLITSPTP